MLKNHGSYQYVGGGYLKQLNKVELKRYLVKRLQKRGLKVTLEPPTAPDSEPIFEGEF